MKIFTIRNGEISEGARVESFTLKGAGISIPAIIIGEEGRGRRLGVLPVQLLPSTYEEWQQKGNVYIRFAEVGTTKAGKPKLLQTENADTLEKCICVFRTEIGFRGGNSHTGDRKEEYWVLDYLWRADLSALGKDPSAKYTKEEAMQLTEELNALKNTKHAWYCVFNKKCEFHPFPGEVLCEGIIAQGAAGRMGSGSQLVAVMPANVVFRTGYSGRLYGEP